ncbi:MAG: hypothetical protein IJX97_02625 [Clostridia bacterium]|nr:hypothetical protein [Clostridia bacterium]
MVLGRRNKGSAQQPGSLYENCAFTYDAYGRRISKSYTYDPNTSTTGDYSYTYNTTYNYDNSGRLIREYCVERFTYTGGGTNTRDITYLYDETGIVGAVQTYNGTTETFYFDRNITGDVIALYNSSGTKVASYVYDAWGNCTTKTLVSNNFSNYNPVRYRGYYYDRETGLAIVGQRYYNSELRRFIQPASFSSLNPQSINGLNLYSYSNYNPFGIANSSSIVAGPIGGGKVSTIALGSVIGRGSSFTGSNGFSIKFPTQNWLSLGIDFAASMSGSLSVLRWTLKNPEFYEFWYTAYGISKYEILSNLKSPLTKIASVISYGLVAYDTYTDVMGHINANDSWQTTTASGIVTAGVGVFNVWASAKGGAAVGTAFGGIPGFIIGTAAGMVVGVVINGIFYTEINGKSIAGHIEDGIEWFLEWIS